MMTGVVEEITRGDVTSSTFLKDETGQTGVKKREGIYKLSVHIYIFSGSLIFLGLLFYDYDPKFWRDRSDRQAR